MRPCRVGRVAQERQRESRPDGRVLFASQSLRPAGAFGPAGEPADGIFTGVLERTPDLGLALARSWFADECDPGSAFPAALSANRVLQEDGLVLRSLQSQRFTHSGWFVDLELRFGRELASMSEDVVVWVEIKHGAHPHHLQLSNYLQDIRELGVRAGGVVLLAPRRSYPFVPEPPAEVVQQTWQRAAGRCRRWHTDSEVEKFLVDEFLAYLKEESLMDPEAHHAVSPRRSGRVRAREPGGRASVRGG